MTKPKDWTDDIEGEVEYRIARYMQEIDETMRRMAKRTKRIEAMVAKVDANLSAIQAFSQGHGKELARIAGEIAALPCLGGLTEPGGLKPIGDRGGWGEGGEGARGEGEAGAGNRPNRCAL